MRNQLLTFATPLNFILPEKDDKILSETDAAFLTATPLPMKQLVAEVTGDGGKVPTDPTKATLATKQETERAAEIELHSWRRAKVREKYSVCVCVFLGKWAQYAYHC